MDIVASSSDAATIIRGYNAQKNAAKNSTPSVAWVDIALSATIRSDTVGPAASRTVSSAQITTWAMATAS